MWSQGLKSSTTIADANTLSKLVLWITGKLLTVAVLLAIFQVAMNQCFSKKTPGVCTITVAVPTAILIRTALVSTGIESVRHPVSDRARFLAATKRCGLTNTIIAAETTPRERELGA